MRVYTWHQERSGRTFLPDEGTPSRNFGGDGSVRPGVLVVDGIEANTNMCSLRELLHTYLRHDPPRTDRP